MGALVSIFARSICDLSVPINAGLAQAGHLAGRSHRPQRWRKPCKSGTFGWSSPKTLYMKSSMPRQSSLWIWATRCLSLRCHQGGRVASAAQSW